MRKTGISIVVMVMMVTAAAVSGFAQGGSEAKQAPAMSSDGGSTMMAGDAMAADAMATDGMSGKITYTSLDDAKKLAAERPTVLFFYADWCPTCRTAMAEIDKRPGDLSKVALVIVNYDRESALKKQYGVTYQHTFVQIGPDGNALQKWNGGGVDEILGKVSS